MLANEFLLLLYFDTAEKQIALAIRIWFIFCVCPYHKENLAEHRTCDKLFQKFSAKVVFGRIFTILWNDGATFWQEISTLLTTKPYNDFRLVFYQTTSSQLPLIKKSKSNFLELLDSFR